MAEPIRPSQISHDVSALAAKLKEPFSQNGLNERRQLLQDPRVDKAGKAAAQHIAARSGSQRGSSFAKRAPRKTHVAAKQGFDDSVPDWARSEVKAPQRANACPAGSTTLRLRPFGDAAQGVDPLRPAPLLTVQQTAELLNVSTKTVSRLIMRGELTALRIGRSVRVSPVELERLLMDSNND